MSFFKFLIMMLVFTTSFSHLVYAQSYQLTPAYISEQQSQPKISMPDSVEEKEMTVIRDTYQGRYDVSNIENLSKLYWRLGAFDIEDEKAITDYIKINDCKIFEEYGNNDLEWKKIIEEVKSHLKHNSNNFSLNYQFVLGLTLGKYDSVKGGFETIDNTGFVNSKLINVATTDYGQEICGDSTIRQIYPKSVVILLTQPFNLTFLNVDEHIAQAFILSKKNSPKRNAYLRLRVSFDQYIGNLRGDNENLFSAVRGRVDGYEVFEDSSLKNLIASGDFKN